MSELTPLSPLSTYKYAVLRLSVVIFQELSLYYANWRSAVRTLDDDV